MADRLKNMQGLWHAVGNHIKNRTIKECFDKEQSPDGTAWKPLSQWRVKERLKKHKSGNMKILQDNGHLRRSIQFRAFPNYVIIGSNLKYSRIHQFGGYVTVKREGEYKHKSKKHNAGDSYSYSWKIPIPARPYLGITEQDKQYILKTFEAFIARQNV